jgi:hypothetical protein
MTGQRYIDTGIDQVNGADETLLPATHFGPRGFENDLPAEYRQSQGDKVMELTYNWDTSTDDYTADQDSSRLVIPANSWIVGGYVTCLVPYATNTAVLRLEETGAHVQVVSLGSVVDGDQAAIGQVFELATNVPILVTEDVTIDVVCSGGTAGESTLTLIYRTADDRTGTQS